MLPLQFFFPSFLIQFIWRSYLLTSLRQNYEWEFLEERRYRSGMLLEIWQKYIVFTYKDNIIIKWLCCHCFKSSICRSIYSTMEWRISIHHLCVYLTHDLCQRCKNKCIYFSTILAVCSHSKLHFTFTDFLRVRTCSMLSSWAWNGKISSLLLIYPGVYYWNLYQISQKRILPPYVVFRVQEIIHICSFMVHKKLYYGAQRARDDVIKI